MRVAASQTSDPRSTDSDATRVSSPSQLQLALGFRPVHTERIEFGDLMLKTFLRRDRNDHSAIGQQDRLAQLQIPVAQRQSLCP